MGENGTGKTTALHFLAAHSRMFQLDGGTAVSRGSNGEIAFYVPGIRGITRGVGSPNPRIAVSMIDGLNLTGAVDQIRTNALTWDCTSEWSLRKNEAPFDPPVCYVYGTGRRSRASSLNREEHDREPTNIFFEETALLNAEEWLLRSSTTPPVNNRASRPNRRSRLEMVKGVLVRVLPRRLRDSIYRTARGRGNTDGRIQDAIWVGPQLRQLGYGYRAMTDLDRRPREPAHRQSPRKVRTRSPSLTKTASS